MVLLISNLMLISTDLQVNKQLFLVHSIETHVYDDLFHMLQVLTSLLRYTQAYT